MVTLRAACNVGRLRGTTDEGAVAIVVELNALVGFVHVVHYLRLLQKDDKVLRDETDHFLLHVLGNPDATVFRHAKHAADDAHVGAVEVAGAAHCVRVARGDGHLGQVGSNFLGVRIYLLDQLVDVLSLLDFNDVTAHALAHLDELYQRVGVGDGVDVAQVVSRGHWPGISSKYLPCCSFLFDVFKDGVEWFLGEFHHFVTIGPGVEARIHDERGNNVGQGRDGGGRLVEAGAAKEQVHAFTHHLFLGVGGAELVELLAPLVNLVAQVDLHRADALTAVAKRTGRDVARMLLDVAQHAEVDAHGAGNEVAVAVASRTTVDGTGVHARTTADALQHLPMLWIANPF